MSFFITGGGQNIPYPTSISTWSKDGNGEFKVAGLPVLWLKSSDLREAEKAQSDSAQEHSSQIDVHGA
jgi:hypothetical protein